MSVGLSGNLGDFGIADVFQLIGQQRKTGLLALRTRGSEASLVFDQGSVVIAIPSRDGDVESLGDKLVRCGLLQRQQAQELAAAARASAEAPAQIVVERGWLSAEDVERIEELLTRDTIFEVLRWQSGSFDFRARDVTHHRDSGALLGAEQILMDGLRMLDEWRSFESRVPGDGSVFQRAGRFEAYRQRAVNKSAGELLSAERMFSLIDGRLSARRVIELAQLGSFDGMRVLAEFVDAGLISQARPVRGRSRDRRPRVADRLAALRRGLAVVLPLAVLAVVSGVARPWPKGAPIEGAFPIERASLERAREAHATRRVRRAIDVFRLLEGRWPRDLEEVSGAGLLDAEALAAPAGRPYYSLEFDDGVVVLAPER